MRRQSAGSTAKEAVYTRGVSAKLQIEGVTMERDSLSRIEIGTRFVTDYELKVLAKVLGVSPLWLLDDENE